MLDEEERRPVDPHKGLIDVCTLFGQDLLANLRHALNLGDITGSQGPGIWNMLTRHNQVVVGAHWTSVCEADVVFVFVDDLGLSFL